eukprot:gnl/TRDRNA2_/TRDRNA2_201499_c0_seq1.p1 gnl/TRDRNA2_/TRDRNA2_201499_c0~~gnl/TRDRNA2_/TRDRNA2_201499_c0_seq1.p1  ORF type:complete len:208 (+),score=19.30 gnl/TRDRNA2_/TRDRNA2_201499_c0_seq1:114-737(+)
MARGSANRVSDSSSSSHSRASNEYWLPSPSTVSSAEDGQTARFPPQGPDHKLWTVRPPDEKEIPSPHMLSSQTLVERLHQEFEVPLSELRILEAEGLLTQIPLNPEGGLSSVGSIDHAAGKCNPCAYWFKGLCAHSILCRHCHLLHSGQKPKRLRPSKRERLRIACKQEEMAALDQLHNQFRGCGSGDTGTIATSSTAKDASTVLSL